MGTCRAGFLVLTILACSSAGAAAVDARELTAVGVGGSSQEAMRKVYFEPFRETTGIPLIDLSWSNGIGVLRAKVRSGASDWDLVQMEPDELQIACEDGLLERMDWSALGKTRFLPQGVTDCGMGYVIGASAIVYDADQLAQGPRDWAEFWDTKAFPGKRAMRRSPRFTLEFALMADGVPASKVYDVLKTREGVDRAFRRLDALRPNIIWWTSPAEPIQLLASKEVALAATYTSRVFAADKSDGKHFKVVWKDSLSYVISWAITKGSPNSAQALALLKFISDPARMQSIPPLTFQGAVIKEAANAADPGLAPMLPSSSANLSQSFLLDADFWADNADALTQRFNTWISQ